MLKIIFIIITAIHGLIHLMGFVKAYNLVEIPQLTGNISKPIGILWLITSMLFLVSGGLFLAKKEWWWLIALVAVILSQLIIIISWDDAKFGTILNIFILLVVIVSIGGYFFEQNYRKDVTNSLLRSQGVFNDVVTENDLTHLPRPVSKYLKYVGVIGKPKVNNVYVVLEGQMRERGKDYFSFTSEQYNFYDEPSRLFFMKAKMFGLNVLGYHRYMGNKAGMDIRIFGLFSVVKHDDLFAAETVTLFNDICLLSPAKLIDKNIIWREIDDLTVKAEFTNKGVTISAILYFNEAGQLVNFVSDDRIAVADMKKYRFSTPISQYKNINGYNLPSYGEAVWHYPDGEFVYGKMWIRDVKYNER